MRAIKALLSQILVITIIFLITSNVFAESDKSIIAIINKVSPSVVGVIGNIRSDAPSYQAGAENMVFGTGVIIKSNGYIITNAHVVVDMENIIVVLSNSCAYQARLKAIDEKTDLAMIKIDKGELIPVEFGDIKDVQVGETVVAIGTPLSMSLRNSATKGMISGLNRSIQSEYRFIQSDAAINGGNSGGPLVNMEGKVVGINSIKYTGDGIEGMSFSIPVDTVKYAINQFEKYGEIRRPYLGVSIIEGIAARYGLPSNEGITITEVKKGTPASVYGLLSDDIITRIDGTNITTLVDFYEAMKNYLPGSSAVFSIKRNEKIIKVKIIFGSTPKNEVN